MLVLPSPARRHLRCDWSWRVPSRDTISTDANSENLIAGAAGAVMADPALDTTQVLEPKMCAPNAAVLATATDPALHTSWSLEPKVYATGTAVLTMAANPAPDTTESSESCVRTPCTAIAINIASCAWCGCCSGCDCGRALCEWVTLHAKREVADIEPVSAFPSQATTSLECPSHERYAPLESAPRLVDVSMERDSKTCAGSGAHEVVCPRDTDESLPSSCKPDWWSDADLTALPALQTYASVASLLDVRVVRHAPAGQHAAGAPPWSLGNSAELYQHMGMRNAERSYVATWLNMGSASLLSLAEVVNQELLERCTQAEDFLFRRLKLVPGLMKAKFPLPSPGPDMAETVGGFFGMQNVSCFWYGGSAGGGPRHMCVQVDLYSKWYVRMGMQSGCFRLGNVVELMLVDTPGRAVIAAFRISVTQEFLRLLN